MKNSTQELSDTNDVMTTAERVELSRVVRMRAKIRRADVDEFKARQLAEVEKQLATTYAANDKRWATITAFAQKAVKQADAAIRKICVEQGIAPEFRPGLSLGWYGRGENAFAARRTELRRVASTQLELNAKNAKLQVDRAEAALLEQITARALRTDDARKFLEAMPSIEQLMPNLTVGELDKKLPLPKEDEPDWRLE